MVFNHKYYVTVIGFCSVCLRAGGLSPAVPLCTSTRMPTGLTLVVPASVSGVRTASREPQEEQLRRL